MGLDSKHAATPLGDSLASSAPATAVDTPWLAASASRRKNPYLSKPEPKEYQEVLNPKELGESLARVCCAVAAEWEDDLALMASTDKPAYRRAQAAEFRRRLRARRKHCRENPDDEECRLDEETFQASFRPPPPFESAERGRDGSTPLRRTSYELLQRFATLTAIKALREDLAVGGMLFPPSRKKGEPATAGPAAARAREAATLEWFNDFLAQGQWLEALAEITTSRYRPDLSDVTLDTVSDRLVTALELRAPSFPKPREATGKPGGGAGTQNVEGGDKSSQSKVSENKDETPEGGPNAGRMGSSDSALLVDPPALAQALLAHREQTALALAKQIAGCEAVLQTLLRECEDRAMLERSVA